MDTVNMKCESVLTKAAPNGGEKARQRELRHGPALPPLLVGAMNRTLSLIPSRHAALPPAPPPSRHVVGVKPWGVREETGAEIRDHPPSPPVSSVSSPGPGGSGEPPLALRLGIVPPGGS